MELAIYKRGAVVALICIAQMACTSKPTIHIYGKYLSENSIKTLEQSFLQLGYEANTNQLDTPVSVTENTILYSLMLEHQETLDKAQEVVEASGYKVNLLQPMVRGNHWYTKNSLALILFPEDSANNSHFFHQDLVHQYQVEECDTDLVLKLNPDFSYQISGKEWNEEELPLVSGSWHYRQFPYVELRPGNNTQWHMYFEISRSTTSDQISAIQMQKLSPLEPYSLISGCTFEIGQRVTG